MSNFFNDNLLNKMQTDPVMNAIFNSQQKMVAYDKIEFGPFGPAPAYAIGHTVRNRGRQPVRQGDIPPSFQAAWHQPGVYRDDWNRAGDRRDAGNVHERYYTRYNPGLYWMNWMPQNLYNINYVNTPNPLFKTLRKTPIHISSVHQSFSS